MPQSPEFSRKLTNRTAGASNEPDQCARRELSETKCRERERDMTEEWERWWSWEKQYYSKRARIDRTQKEMKKEKRHKENAFYKHCHILSVLFKKVSRYRSAHARRKCAEKQASLKIATLCSRENKNSFCKKVIINVQCESMIICSKHLGNK